MHCNLAVALLLQYTGYLTLDVVELEVLNNSLGVGQKRLEYIVVGHGWLN